MNIRIVFLLTLSTSIFCNDFKCNDFKIESIYHLLQSHPEIKYTKCNDVQSFNYKLFPIAKFPELQPNKGLLAESFILKIPNGQVCSFKGWIKVDKNIIRECIGQYASGNNHIYHINNTKFENLKKINGRVAVISSECDQYYGHWLYNILGRLALLKMNNIEYDWLYVANDKSFMQETLAIFGVDPSKIIKPFGDTKYIQADELIVPSLIGSRTPQSDQYPLTIIPLDQYCNKWNISHENIHVIDYVPTPYIPSNISIEKYFTYWTPLCAFYPDQYVIEYIRNIFLSKANIENSNFSKRVFISRKDAAHRTMLNEDEVFALFESYGFKRYILADLSVLEKVALFNNAKYIIGQTGSGLMNVLFCKPNTIVAEIFQTYSDCATYYLAQSLNLQYHCIQTMPFKDIGWGEDTSIKLDIIQKYIDTNLINKE